MKQKKIIPEKRTVGAIAYDLLQKVPESRDPIEIEREMQRDYLKNLVECVTEYKKSWPDDFYIVVLTKQERLMHNIFRNYFFGRKSCPTPNYDQSVFKFNAKRDDIEYIWSIPSQDACHHLKENALIVDNAEKELLKFVILFADGTLFKIAKMRNNEQPDSPLLLERN